MSCVILYSSKYGGTLLCAEKLAESMNVDSTFINLDKNSNPDLSKYQSVIIGTSIYIGAIRKSVKMFCKNYLSILETKKVGFFISCLAKESEANLYFEKSFDEILLSNAAAIGVFGPVVNYDKMNFFEKMILKKITGKSESFSKIDDEQIIKFADKFNSGV